MMTKAAEQAIRGGVIAIAATMLALALAPSGAFAAACPPAILKCGCTISYPGTYTLSGPNPMLLNSTEGTICVHITASDVTLVDGPTLQGQGSKTSMIGVDIDIYAKSVTLQSVEATNFGQGIVIDGSSATVKDAVTSFNNQGTVVNGANALLIGLSSNRDGAAGILVNHKATNFEMMSSTADEATGAGIELNGVSGAVLNSAVANDNVTFGIWLKSASNNVLTNCNAEDNGTAGVYLGCNAAGPIGNPVLSATMATRSQEASSATWRASSCSRATA